MALLRATPMSIVMAGTVGVPVVVSSTSVGLEIKEAVAKLVSRFSEKQNWAGRRADSRGRRECGLVVMARTGGGGSARSPRPSTSRGPPKQHESERNSSPISRKKAHKAAKIIANLIVLGSGVVLREVSQAYRQAIVILRE